jgi:hypothetical protein
MGRILRAEHPPFNRECMTLNEVSQTAKLAAGVGCMPQTKGAAAGLGNLRESLSGR